MRPYETLFVLRADVPDAQIRETTARARRVIESHEGTVEEINEWGVRELAYPIRKQTRGYYVLAEYTATSEAVREFERTLKLADEVLRHTTVRRVPGRQGVSQRPRPESETREAPPEAEAGAIKVEGADTGKMSEAAEIGAADAGKG